MDLSYSTFQQNQSPSNSGADLSYNAFQQAKTAAPQPSFMSKVGSAISGYAQDSANTVTTLGNAILHPIDTFSKIPDLFTKPLIAGEQKAGEALYNLATNSRPTGPQGNSIVTPKDVASTADLITGLANSALSPITGLFTLGENTPGLKQVADTMNIPFTATGFAGSWASGKAIDWIPSAILPQASKDIIKKPIQDLTSLAAQTVLGGAIMDKISGEVKQGKTITPETAQNIVEQSKAETQNHPAIAPPQSDLSFNNYQKTVASNLAPESTSLALAEVNPGKDTIQPQSKINQTELSATPQSNSGLSSEQSTISSTEIQPTGEAQKVGRTTQTLKPIEGTGETKVRGLSQGVEAKAIENKLTSNFGDLPEYQAVSMAEQAQRASDLITKDHETAKSIALGEKAPPKGVLPESVFVAVENKAIAEGDVQTLQDLANSKLSASATTMGQRIRTLGERDPTSPVGAIQEVQKARADALQNKDIAKQVQEGIKQIQDSIKSVKTTKETWGSFVDSITC